MVVAGGEREEEEGEREEESLAALADSSRGRARGTVQGRGEWRGLNGARRI